MSELTYIRPGSTFLGARDGWDESRMRAVIELRFAHPTHGPSLIRIDHDVWMKSGIRVEPGKWEIDGSPGDLFDEPSPVSVPPRAGERAAWRMARGESAVNQAGMGPVADGCAACGETLSLDRGPDGLWYCPEGCRPDDDPVDPAGDAA